MKITGIVAEYNPFHNGHAYQLAKARELTGADYLVVIMSGDFVQRGAPAILDQHDRAELALLGGADLAHPLPRGLSLCFNVGLDRLVVGPILELVRTVAVVEPQAGVHELPNFGICSAELRHGSGEHESIGQVLRAP